MIKGAHLPNRPLQISDAALYNQGGFEGGVVFDYQDPGLASLIAQPCTSVVRLPNSTISQGVAKGDTEWAGECEKAIRAFYARGYRVFQWDNEPNLSWVGFTPPPGQTVPQVWRWLSNDVLDKLAPVFAELPGITILFTPLSHPEDHLDWWNEGRTVRDRCQGIAAHCYWQRSEHMQWDQFGEGFHWIRTKMQQDGEPLRDIWVTECGNSKRDETPRPPAQEIENAMVADYPQYVPLARTFPYVRGVYFFILAHNGDWSGFEMTPRVLAALHSVRGTSEPSEQPS